MHIIRMSEQSWLNATPPKTAFTFGIITGLAASFIPGFFLLLSFSGNGILPRSVTSAPAPSATAPTPVAPEPSAPANVTVAIRDDDHIRGNKKAKLTIVEFSDFQCPYCQDYAPSLQQALNEYKNEVRLVYRHFPIDSRHPFARAAAEASECANEQGKFWEYHDELFKRQGEFSNDLWGRIAADLKLKTGKFDQCVKDRKYKQRVDDDYQTGIAAGARGTPHTVIGTTPISGVLPYESIKQIIDQML